MNKKLLVIVPFLTGLYALWRWFGCARFADAYHFSSLDLSLRLIEAIHNDRDVPIVVTRLFHNKVIGTILDIYNEYILYYDVQFLIQIISLVGLFGLLCGIWYLLSNPKHRKKGMVVVGFLIILPLVEIASWSRVPFPIQLLVFVVPLHSVSLYGLVTYLGGGSYWRICIVLGISILSIWWLLILPSTIYNYCIQ